jgi:tetratricopeptide (TPR) repeat protein
VFNGVYHSPPHALAGFLLAGNLLAGARQHQAAGRTTDSDSRSIRWAILIAATGAIIFNALVVSIPSFDLAALPSADESLTASSREQYDQALARPWPSPIVEVQGSMLMLEEGETGEARTYLMRAKRRLDTGRLHYLLGYLAELKGDARQAEAAYEAAVWRWPRNLDAWLGWMGVTPQERRETRLAEAQRWLSEADMRLLRDATTLH